MRIRLPSASEPSFSLALVLGNHHGPFAGSRLGQRFGTCVRRIDRLEHEQFSAEKTRMQPFLKEFL